MATDEGFPDTTDPCTTSATCPVHPDEDCPGAFDPGPVPPAEHTMESVNAERDAMALSDYEQQQFVDYVIGYDPVTAHDALTFLRSIRARRAAALLEA